MSKETYRVVKTLAMAIALVLFGAFLYWYSKQHGTETVEEQVSVQDSDYQDVTGQETSKRLNPIGFKYQNEPLSLPQQS